MKTPTKKLGELAELLFAAKASALGFTVSRPWGDSDPFDFIVSHGRRMSRVQVRSTGYQTRDGVFRAHTYNSRGRQFSARDYDIFAFYVMPADAWYIIPARLLRGQTHVWAIPFQPHSHSRFERFREAWHRLIPRCPKRLLSRITRRRLPPHLRRKSN